jgi:rifampicin phosphotransferase
MKELEKIMNSEFTLPLDDKNATLELVGGKGASLARMAGNGFPIPGGFHITTDAYRQFVDDNDLQPAIMKALQAIAPSQPSSLDNVSLEIRTCFEEAEISETLSNAITNAYAQISSETPAVAVRSSATAEDLPEASFAGQQDTFLNVLGEDALLAATKKCWSSLWTARAIGYRSRQNIPDDQVALAVVVQILIPADSAGILFTANPINGQRGQAVISASWGLGEAVVGGLVTPDSFTVDKAKHTILERQIADKEIMTVRLAAGTEEQPVPEELRQTPALKDDQVIELTSISEQIEQHYDMPMDIEWTLSPHPHPLSLGERGARGEEVFHIVQARPITVLPEPPLSWELPHPKGVYMRGSIVDLMPDPLSPLFITLGIETLKTQMRPLGKRLTRMEPVLANDYFTAINNYAYMNSHMPSKTLKWIIFGLLPSYPRIFRTMVSFWRESLSPEYHAFVAQHRDINPGEMAAQELWTDAQGILDAVMYYVCGLMFATMGASAGSEGLLVRVYNKFAKQEGDPDASALLMGWDNIPVRSEKSLFDLAAWCQDQPQLKEHLLSTPSESLVDQILKEAAPPGIAEAQWSKFSTKFNQHLDVYGHMIYQLDFSEPLPLDHPEPMIETLKMFLRGEGANPHVRQEKSEALRLETTAIMLKRLKGLKHWIFTKALNWGQSMAEVREDALSEIGLGYPMFRALLLELGARLTAQGVLDQASDIFMLEKAEVEAGVSSLMSAASEQDFKVRVNQRQAFMARVEQIAPPPMMPEKKRVMGVKTELFIPQSTNSHTGDTIKGEATSLGVVTAPACVLRGPEDFSLMQPGSVLVAGTTTPAWTPLFSMAAAVVTDIGGPLSHGSIVAREFGIPAVMGTGVATKRIQNEQMITVDGNEGTVTLLSEASHN